MTCCYPHNTGQTAYWKGCRCERCIATKAEASARRPKRYPSHPCPSCGALKWMPGGVCAACVKRPPIDRVMDKIQIDATTGCWLFTGNRNQQGYGIIATDRHGRVAHRVTYEHFVGPVPDGLELDHLCRTQPCCNPDHLEAVTHTENIRRDRAWRKSNVS